MVSKTHVQNQGGERGPEIGYFGSVCHGLILID